MTSRKAIVVESYDYSPTRIVVTIEYTDGGGFFFLFLPKTPVVSFGDIIEMDLEKDRVYLSRGNEKLRFQLHPDDFPPGVLGKLIEDRIS